MVVCACLAGGSILDIIALYCECYCVVVGLFFILFFTLSYRFLHVMLKFPVFEIFK